MRKTIADIAAEEESVTKIEVTHSVLELVCAQFGLSNPQPGLLEREFEDDLGGDVLDMVELVMELEDEFYIEIDDDDAAKWKTPLNAIEFICGKLQVTA